MFSVNDIIGNVFVWMIAAFLLMIIVVLYTVMFFMLAKKTHAVKELRASWAGKPLCLFFNQHKQVDWVIGNPEAGVIQDEKYGTFLINEEGSYIDKTTRNVILPFSAEIGTGASVQAFAAADEISEVLKDKKQMGDVRLALAQGALDDTRFYGLRESVNFSELKGLLNTMTPHNTTSLISKSISHQMGSMGQKEGVQFFWYALLGLAVLVLAGIVMYVVMGRGDGASTVTLDAASIATALKYQLAQNATVMAG
jgi:uncharacterized protein (UPF0333 family)